MPRISKLNLPRIDFGGETLGQRIARIRKVRGFTQVDLAEKIGLVQNVVSASEWDRLKLSAEMAVCFAAALEVGMEEPLKPVERRVKNGRKPSRRSCGDWSRSGATVCQTDRAPSHHRQVSQRRRDSLSG